MARIERIILPRSATESCSSLINLLEGDCFKSEVSLLRVTCLQTSLRFRSSHESRLLSQMCRSLDKVCEESTSDIDNWLKDLVNSSSRNKLETAIKLMKTLEKISHDASRCLKLNLWSFGETARWMRVGHLAPHLLTLISVLSRLRFILKAILVHSNELFKDVYSASRLLNKDRLNREGIQSSLDHLLDPS